MKQTRAIIKQQGTILITALLIIAVVATIATAMALRQQIDIRRTELELGSEQTYLYSQTVTTWATQYLTTRLKKKNAILILPVTYPITQTPGVTITGALTDAQALYNLNDLSKPNNKNAFIALITAVDSSVDVNSATLISNALTAWLSPHGQNPDTLSESSYLQANPPYRIANQSLVSVSELRLIKGVTAKLYNRLEPYITVLPDTQPININSAPAQVLMTLANNMTLAQAQAIIAYRKAIGGFTDTSALTKTPGLQGININSSNTTVLSNYYLVVANVDLNNQHLVVYSLLKASVQNNSTQNNSTQNNSAQNNSTQNNSTQNNNVQNNSADNNQVTVNLLWQRRGFL